MSSTSYTDNIPSPDQNQALRQHIVMIYHAADPLRGQGKLVLSSFGQNPTTGEKLPPRILHFEIGDVEGMVAAVERLSQEPHRNIYLSVAVFRPDLPSGSKGGEGDIIGVLGLVADLDDEQAHRWAERVPTPPDLVLETSAGRFQAFILFDAPLSVEKAKKLAIGLKNYAKCDAGTSDVSHVWRLAGTLNHPNKSKVDKGRPPTPQQVNISMAWDGDLTDVDALESALPARTKNTAEETNPKGRCGEDFLSHVNSASFKHLDKWVQKVFPKAIFQPGTKAYRISSVDLERDLEEDLSIHPNGIRDFGEEKGLTPIHVVMEYGGASTALEAAFALCGWLDIDPGALGWNAKAASQWNPKPDQPKWPEPLGADAFYGLAGEIIRAIEPQSEADQAALLIQFLVAFGNIIGRFAYYLVEGTRHYTNLFAVLVGQSSKSRKGTSWDRIAEMFETISDDWRNKCTHGGMSSGEGLVYPVRDATTKCVIDKKTKEITTVIDDPGSTDKRLLVQESEFAGALRVMRREGNTLSRVVRDAWDRLVLEFMTKNSRIRAEGAHVSIVGHITTEELKRELTATDMANGFANRFLFICAKRSKLLPMGGARSAEMIAAAEKLKSLVEKLRNKQMFTSNDDLVGSSQNAELTWSADALDLWRENYAELSEGKPGMLGSVTARAEAQVVRLSLIYAVLDDATAIEVAHLRAALAVWRYSEASSAYIWGDTLGDSAADSVLQALRAAGTAGLSRTNISALFDRHKGSQELARVLNLLLERRLATTETRESGGRPVEVWWAI